MIKFISNLIDYSQRNEQITWLKRSLLIFSRGAGCEINLAENIKAEWLELR